jgi:metal-responsive CopG/Arc/MetJ family transcriptional regulator
MKRTYAHKQQVGFPCPIELLEIIDEAAEAQGCSRSEMIRSLLSKALKWEDEEVS